MPLRKLVAGNWKMNGVRAELAEFRHLLDALAAEPAAAAVVVCPPATLLHPALEMIQETADGGVEVGGQDCSQHASGAHTGDLAAAMLADAGARWVILGHSERRAEHG